MKKHFPTRHQSESRSSAQRFLSSTVNGFIEFSIQGTNVLLILNFFECFEAFLSSISCTDDFLIQRSLKGGYSGQEKTSLLNISAHISAPNGVTDTIFVGKVLIKAFEASGIQISPPISSRVVSQKVVSKTLTFIGNILDTNSEIAFLNSLDCLC